MKETKTVQEWCISCLFNEMRIGKKLYYVSRTSVPVVDGETCVQCLYEKVRDFKVTKPKQWRKLE